MKDLAERIQDRLKTLKMSQASLGKMLGLTQGQIGHYVKGRRVPPPEQIIKLEKALQTAPGWLMYGDKVNIYQNQVKHVITQTFPILKASEIVEWMRHPVIAEKHRTVTMPVIDENLSKSAFVFQTIGMTMVNRVNPEVSLFPGELALIDNERKPKDGDLVLVSFGENDFRIRQYREDGVDVLLYAFDPNINAVSLTNKLKIFGIVVGSYRQR